MGQQQLLLIVLGIIIVGIAVAVGINMFRSSAVDANRNAVISDLAHLASKAQQHLKKPISMGGGAQLFTGFQLNTLDKANDNGWYQIQSGTTIPNTVVAPDTTNYVATATDSPLVIRGWGVEIGDDGVNVVQGWTLVSGVDFQSGVLN